MCGKQREATAPIYSIRGKTADLVPEFMAEDMLSAELQAMFLFSMVDSEIGWCNSENSMDGLLNME